MGKRGRKHILRKRMRNLFAAAILALAGSVVFGTFLVSAHENTGNDVYTYYRSIEIQPGDTLWDIAEETMTSEYDSTAEYVQVLKDMNNLSSDHIQSGMHLMIAYEDTELK